MTCKPGDKSLYKYIGSFCASGDMLRAERVWNRKAEGMLAGRKHTGKCTVPACRTDKMVGVLK